MASGAEGALGGASSGSRCAIAAGGAPREQESPREQVEVPHEQFQAPVWAAEGDGRVPPDWDVYGRRVGGQQIAAGAGSLE